MKRKKKATNNSASKKIPKDNKRQYNDDEKILKQLKAMYIAIWIFAFVLGMVATTLRGHRLVEGVVTGVAFALIMNMCWLVYLHWSRHFPSFSELVQMDKKFWMTVELIVFILTFAMIFGLIIIDVMAQPTMSYKVTMVVIGVIFATLMLSKKRSIGVNFSFWIMECGYMVILVGLCGMCLNKSLDTGNMCDTFETTISSKYSEEHANRSVWRRYHYVRFTEADPYYGIGFQMIYGEGEDDSKKDYYESLNKGDLVRVEYYEGFFRFFDMPNYKICIEKENAN